MKHNKKNKLQYYEKNYIKKDKSILMLQDTFTDSQPYNTQSIQKTFRFNRLCRALFADHFGNKTFLISLKNDDIIVKILNTVKYRVPQNVCNIVYFSNISAQTNDKILGFFSKDTP